MLLFLTRTVGWLLAHCPESGLRALASTLGWLTYHGYRPRRRVMLHSLGFAFPEKPATWHQQIALTSCIRLMETALLSLAASFLPEQRVRGMFAATPATIDLFTRQVREKRPLLLGTCHLAYWEGLTWLPLKFPAEVRPEISVIFRPLRDPALDAWLRQTRERFGVHLMSRRSGLHAALHVLQRQGVVGLLFDQSAGSHGYLTRFLNKECSTTPLPGLLVEKTGADLGIIFARRQAFWRFTVDVRSVAAEPTPEAVTLALNREFEALLRGDENLCASWLWMHQRWRIMDRPGELEKLVAKRGGLIG